MMKQLVIFFFLIDGLLGSNSLYAQKTELMPDGQRNFFEGYWKYASQNRDTVFIIKLKYLPIENGLNCYIGSYLYFDPEIKENNFQVLSDYLDMNTYEEFWEVYFESLRAGNNFIAIDVSGKNFYERKFAWRTCASVTMGKSRCSRAFPPGWKRAGPTPW